MRLALQASVTIIAHADLRLPRALSSTCSFDLHVLYPLPDNLLAGYYDIFSNVVANIEILYVCGHNLYSQDYAWTIAHHYSSASNITGEYLTLRGNWEDSEGQRCAKCSVDWVGWQRCVDASDIILDTFERKVNHLGGAKHCFLEALDQLLGRSKMLKVPVVVSTPFGICDSSDVGRSKLQLQKVDHAEAAAKHLRICFVDVALKPLGALIHSFLSLINVVESRNWSVLNHCTPLRALHSVPKLPLLHLTA